MCGRGLEEFGDGNSLATDEELGGGMMGFVEGGDARQSLLATAAFDFNRDEGVAALNYEIHFEIPFAPIANMDSGAHGGVDEMGSDGGFGQAAPGIAIGTPGFWIAAGLCGHERGVENLQLGTGGTLADLGAGKLLQAGDHARAFEKMEVISERDGIPASTNWPSIFW